MNHQNEMDQYNETASRKDPRPNISIVVPVRNQASEFQQCLKALSICCKRDDAELIVVDDCSTEDVERIAKQYGARYFRLPHRSGPAAARNLGARHAAGNIIVFIDADTVALPDMVQIVRNEFERNPTISALFGSYDDAPACADFWSSFKNLLHHHVHQSSRSQASTFWTGCGAVRKNVFDDLGGFDVARYPEASIEDIDLGVRLTQTGNKVKLVKQLQVKHLKKWTPRSLVHTDILRRAIPWTQLVIRSNYIPSDLNLSWSSRSSAALIAVAVGLIAAKILALFGLRHWPPHTPAAGLIFIVATLLVINRELYRFFFKKRGATFTSAAVLFHWVYLFYSGTVFICCYWIELFRTVFLSTVKDQARELPPLD